MITKTLTYKDFLGNDRTEILRFHISEPEFMKMEFGGMRDGERLTTYINRITQREENDADNIKIMDLIMEIIDRSYGVVSEDGRRFVKDPVALREFKETEAYNLFISELFKDAEKFMTFITELLPEEYRKAAEAEIERLEKDATTSPSRNRTL